METYHVVCGGIENDIVTHSLHDAIRLGEELYAKDTGRTVEEDNVCTYVYDEEGSRVY